MKARVMVDEGWLSISGKYRTVALATENMPSPIDMIAPEYLNTEFGKSLAEYWISHRRLLLRTCDDEVLVTKQDLTVREWKAFKKMGGASA